MMKEAFYLFGLCRCDSEQVVETDGLEEKGATPCIELVGDIGAVIARVDAAQFTGPESEALLADPEWLLPRLQRHNAVLEWVQHRAPLLPLRFGTLFTSRSGLEQLVYLHHAAISRFFEKVEGREEWALKLYCNDESAIKAWNRDMLEIHAAHLGGLSPGKRYLEERRLRAEVERLMPSRLRDECDAVGAILQDYCSDWKERKLLNIENNDGKGRMLRNWALLLPSASVTSLILQLEQYRQAKNAYGLNLEWSGPWPPYSFCPPLDNEHS